MANIPLTDSRLKKMIADTDKAIVTGVGETQKSISDGKGLTLRRENSGSWLWVYRYYKPDGKRNNLPLGAYPMVTLAQAREKHKEARDILAKGIDPSIDRKTEKLKQAVAIKDDFASVARAWWDMWGVRYSKKHADKVWHRIERDILPVLGAYPVKDITPSLVTLAIKGISDRGAYDVAGRAYQNVVNIFRYAVTHELSERNPAEHLILSHIIPPVKTKHHPSIELNDLPKLLQDIDAYEGNRVTVIAMKLMALTFVRTSELIGARWCDVNVKKKQWIIPARIEDEHGEKVYGMKMDAPLTVPLATQTLALLSELRAISGGGTHMFPALAGNKETMSKDTILAALKRMGYKGVMTGHGFRSVATTALYEKGYARDFVELQMSHQVGNDVERAYNNMTLLPKRTAMMQDWADYLDEQRGRGVVLKMKQA